MSEGERTTDFKDGDRITMTEASRRCNPDTKAINATVIKANNRQSWQIQIRRDGLKTIERWHRDGWRYLENEEQSQ